MPPAVQEPASEPTHSLAERPASATRRASLVAWSATGTLVLFAGVGAAAGLWKLLGIGGIAFVAMAGGALLGARSTRGAGRPYGLVWSYGLTSGAMMTSCAAFLVPPAIGYDSAFGGFGIALGLVTGFALHTAGHRHIRSASVASVVVELTAHALAAGVVIGVVYASMPGLGMLLGLSIVSHKGPAGYAAARRLVRNGRPARLLLLPASAVGLTALPAGMLALPDVPLANAVVFGFAAGIFLHVAMDFLPQCETGGEIHDAARRGGEEEPAETRRRLDRLRSHAAASTALGALIVFALWGALRL